MEHKNPEKDGRQRKTKPPVFELPKELEKPKLPKELRKSGGSDNSNRPVSARRKHKPKSGTMIALVMLGIGVGTGWLLLGRFLPKPSSETHKVPVATESARPTTGVEIVPEISKVPDLQYLSVDETQDDADGDAIPDKLEEILGYDPNKNDCVRKLGCGDFPTVPRAKLEINLLFLLDASGSMSDKLEGVTKWDSAKSAMLDVLQSGLSDFANVGIIVYGHKGSSSLNDQAVSCSGVEVLDPLSKVDVDLIREDIDQISPRGWTPLAGALEKAGKVLAGKTEFSQNFVILLSDGKETCGGDPAMVAQKLHESGIELVTNVVGLSVGEEEKKQLELIAQAGGGRYFAANSRNELNDALILAAEAIRLWDKVNQCVVDNLGVYGECINVQYLRSLNYMDRLILKVGEDRGTVSGSGFIEKEYNLLKERIWNKFRELRDENWQQYDEDLKKLYPEK